MPVSQPRRPGGNRTEDTGEMEDTECLGARFDLLTEVTGELLRHSVAEPGARMELGESSRGRWKNFSVALRS
jgi:hypothetical protein